MSHSHNRTNIDSTTVRPFKADTGLTDFLQIMRSALTGPLAEIASHAERLEALHAAGLMPTTLAGEQSFDKFATLSRNYGKYIRRLTELGKLLLETPLEDDERVALDQLVGTVADGLADMSNSRNVCLHVDTGKKVLAPVYGSRHWLTACMEHLLEGLIDAAPACSHIQISLEQVDKHLLLRGSILPHESRAGGRRPAPNQIDQTVHDISDVVTWTQFDLAFVHAVISMYGGMFKSELSESGKLHQFTLTLPTGIPKHPNLKMTCATCPMRQQSLQYASDLADLMARDSATSHPEGDAP